jgi:peptidoglycan/LPS O-acetylase OafA/YrhL
VYLIHIPILTLLAWAVSRRVDLSHVGGVMKIAVMAALVLVATALAYVFFLVCERPFLRRLTLPQAPPATTSVKEAA